MRLLQARPPPGADRRGEFPGPPGPTCLSRRPSCSLQKASRRLSSASWLSSSLACGESRIQSAVGDLGAEAHAVPGRHLPPREGPVAPTRASVFPAPAGCRRGTRPQDDAQTEGLQCSPEAKSRRGQEAGGAGIESGQMGPGRALHGSQHGSPTHTCHQIMPDVFLLLSICVWGQGSEGSSVGTQCPRSGVQLPSAS